MSTEWRPQAFPPPSGIYSNTSFHNAEVHSFGFAGPVLSDKLQWMAAYFKRLAARNIVRQNPRQFERHVRPFQKPFFQLFFYQANCWTWTAKHHLIHMKIHYTTKRRQQNQNELSLKKISSLTWAAGTLQPLYSWLWLVPGPCHRDSSGNQPGTVLPSLAPQMLCIGSCARQEKAAGRW